MLTRQSTAAAEISLFLKFAFLGLYGVDGEI